MPTFTLRFWTGPKWVNEYASQLEEAGVKVITRGTEHVHVESEGGDIGGAAWNVAASFERVHRRPFPLQVR